MEKEIRADGRYVNMLNRVGTEKDPLESYSYMYEPPTPDVELAELYASNGLFAKIINKPAEAAFKYGYDLKISNPETEKYIMSTLEKLKFDEKAVTALKWSRLFGGGALLMAVNDGRDLDEPLDWDNIEGIDQLIVFERPEIQADYNSIYTYSPDNLSMEKFGQPEHYMLNPIYGGQQFRVHESRLLIFKNGELPRTSTSNSDYMFFGAPEYNRIKRELRDTVTTHGNGYRLLERCVQAVYKVKNLAVQLATAEGEDELVNRMHVIDMARSLLNTMLIDADGEDYTFQTFQLSGVKDIIDESCQLLSAVTGIPQTILFGRSPAGENATGESDLSNYYDDIAQTQRIGVKDNLITVVDIILAAGEAKGDIEEIPDYEVEFKPLWNLSKQEQANVDQQNAATELAKAQTTQIYVDMQAVDSSEIRKTLAKNDTFEISDVLSEEDAQELDMLAQLMGAGSAGDNEPPETESYETSNTGITEESEQPKDDTLNRLNQDQADYGVGVIIVEDGKILCGARKDGTGICGPGGHVEDGETAEEAAAREAHEEFNIWPQTLVHIGNTAGGQEGVLPAKIFLCDKYGGPPCCDNVEMEHLQWRSFPQLMNMELFPAFEDSLELLAEVLRGG
ncbi:MAG: DUF1073 domain-containing protein [Lachnospiraceae bacterium]